jgi:hypothetical protein
MDISTAAVTRVITLQSCMYRAERVTASGRTDGVRDLICKAMGGKDLGRLGADDARIAEICNTCTIPQEAAFRPCLYLVPMKVERNGMLKDYFTCRWFYRLRPDRPDEQTRSMCGGCPHWFPMPPIELLPDLERAAQRMIDYHTMVWERPAAPSEPCVAQRAPTPTSRWRRVRETLMQWWGW